MIKEKEEFIKFLSKKDLKLTSQRESILRIFLGIEKHVSIDDLYVLVKNKDDKIGYATVARTMKLIKEAGLAREIDLGEGKKRYEHLFGHKHHDHLVCSNCGKCIEVLDARIEELQEKLAKKYDFKLTTHRMEIIGLCRDCR